jgi:hypothetical protein
VGCLQKYSAIFWVEAEQKESIEQDYLQIYRLFFEPRLVTRIDGVGVEDGVSDGDAAVVVKRQFHG